VYSYYLEVHCVSVYEVHFKWKEKEISLKAKNLDMTHPYFVSIKNLIFSDKPKLIIDPTEDEVRNRFGNAEHIMIPFQSVSLIEEFTDEDKLEEKEKMRKFTVIDKETGKKRDDS
jgi:hypothetical protein